MKTPTREQKETAELMAAFSKSRHFSISQLSKGDALRFLLNPNEKGANADKAIEIAKVICAAAKIVCPIVEKQVKPECGCDHE